MDYYLLIIVILLSAFFSGMEIAFLSSNRLRIELEKRQGTFRSGIIQILVNKPRRFIAAMLIGNNVALVFYGILMAGILEPLFMQYTSNELTIFLLQTLVSTIIILFTGEFFPKVLFSSSPNFFLTFFAVPVYIIYILMYPLTLFFIALSDIAIRLTGRKDPQESCGIVFGRVDLNDYLSRFSGDDEHQDTGNKELKIIRNALDFSSVRIRECSVPRPEICSVELNETIEALAEKFTESGYSKILVYRDSIDDIVGYVHSKDLLKKPKQIRNILHDVMIVPETMLASHLLGLFIKQKKSVAVVVDEFGGTNGMVTIEDILEEILGEIDDEHDVESLEEKELPDNTFVFSGRLEIDYLNAKYFFKLPESDEYETIAGLILTHHKSIPKINESIEIDGYVFKILKSTQTRIERVQMKISGE